MKNLFCLLILIPFFSFSQDEYIVKLDKHTLENHLNGYYIDSVFSITEDSVYLGPVATGAFNSVTPARFQSSISSELGALLRRSGLMNPSGKPLTLRINLLKTWEITGSTELCLVVLNASFLQKENGKWSELFQGISSFRKGGLDVTHLHDDNIVKALDNVINDFNKRVKKGRLRPYPVGNLTSDPNGGRPCYEVFRSGMKKGFYQTFYDLRDHFPDPVPASCQVEYDYDRKDSSKVELSLRIEGIDKDNYPWAFCDGEKYFMRMGKTYYPVELYDTALISYYHAPIGTGMSEGAATAIVASAVMFGLVGGAIAGVIAAASADGPKDSKSIVMPLNFTTGALEKQDILNDLRARSHNVFYFSSTAQEGTTVTLTINSVSNTLAPGDFIRTDLAPHPGKIFLTSSTGITEEAEITPRLFANNVYLIRLKKKGIDCLRPYGDVRDNIMRTVREKEREKDKLQGTK